MVVSLAFTHPFFFIFTKLASTEALYFETGWETLAKRRSFRKITVFYRMHNKLCPSYLYNCLPPLTSDVSRYNLRNTNNYVTPRCRLRTSANSFIPSTTEMWNKLETTTRDSPTLSMFKSKVRENVFKPQFYYSDGPRKLSIMHILD